VLPELLYRLQVARAAMSIYWRNYALGRNGCRSTRVQGNLMVSGMNGSRLEISYVVVVC
jgi:hypothetical protein